MIYDAICRLFNNLEPDAPLDAWSPNASFTNFSGRCHRNHSVVCQGKCLSHPPGPPRIAVRVPVLAAEIGNFWKSETPCHEFG